MRPVAILCGGQGTRMRASGERLPKPLVEVGGRPILWHVMSLYAAQRLRRFVLLLGHGAERIEAFAATLPEEWDVTCLDTGLDTPTGGRVARAAPYLDEGTFCLTYADGVADVDLGVLLRFHTAQGRAATMTVVRPRSPWGVARLAADGRVDGFVEKPRVESWVNGGFMVLEPRALDSIGEDEVLEREPLERLAAARELSGFRHDGFWDCMDTYKDTQLLNELWASGEAPWRPLVGV
ncbi:MAG: Glucose-1-phosphate cytidylyltransferase [uncultured Solirubrobacterales bacterium]|uniref:Glucose-1-phosphate cytidylyltransferase n=1 Tax=uncultured Solirubrobacterales bacterium TaxID=768556 RepID=A0A6J4T2J4_9ACTN|nr:MAG: Glucose-1-phosphate cytidylyltransferase [uncultured Solirubrobacterales bacterium]